MMKHGHLTARLRGFCLVGAALALTATDALAQRPLPPNPRDPFQRQRSVGQIREGSTYIDLRVGLVQPVGDYSKAAGSGPSIGLGVGHWWSEALALQFRLDVDLPGSMIIEEGVNVDLEGPSWRMLHLGAGLFYDLSQGTSSFQIGPLLGLGGTFINSSQFQGDEQSSWYFTISPGLQFGAVLSRNVTFTVDGRYKILNGSKTILNRIVTNLPNAEATMGQVQLQAGFQIALSTRQVRRLPGGRE